MCFVGSAQALDNAITKACTPTRPDEPKPRFRDLRKTGATRVEAVSSHATAKAFPGHSDRDFTDIHIVATLDAVRAAVNRAAFSIDGTRLKGVISVPDESEVAHQVAQQPEAEVS